MSTSLAVSTLTTGPTPTGFARARGAGSDPDAVLSLARRAWRTAPDNEALCLVAARALTRHGGRTEARELILGTRQALTDLGIDPADFVTTAGHALDQAEA